MSAADLFAYLPKKLQGPARASAARRNMTPAVWIAQVVHTFLADEHARTHGLPSGEGPPKHPDRTMTPVYDPAARDHLAGRQWNEPLAIGGRRR